MAKLLLLELVAKSCGEIFLPSRHLNLILGEWLLAGVNSNMDMSS